MVHVTFLDGVTGRIAEDGKGSAGRLTLTARSLGCAADFDGDGSVGFDDLVMVLLYWGTSEAPLDLDDDGVIGFGDLVLVLADWGACATP